METTIRKKLALGLSPITDIKELRKSIAVYGDGHIQNLNCWGYTHLMRASYNNNIEIAQFLIDKGAKLDTQNKLGWTALMYACRQNNYEIMELLIEAKAKLDIKNNKGETVLDLARKYCSEKIIKFLRKTTENKIHNSVNVWIGSGGRGYQSFEFSELLISGGNKLKVKFPDESKYSKHNGFGYAEVHFSSNPLQEGDLTAPCADGSIWRYKNNKWTKWIEDRIEDPLEKRERKIEELKREEAIKREELERKESIKRKKDFIYESLSFALTCGILFFAGIGLITVLSRLLSL